MSRDLQGRPTTPASLSLHLEAQARRPPRAAHTAPIAARRAPRPAADPGGNDVPALPALRALVGAHAPRAANRDVPGVPLIGKRPRPVHGMRRKRMVPARRTPKQLSGPNAHLMISLDACTNELAAVCGHLPTLGEGVREGRSAAQHCIPRSVPFRRPGSMLHHTRCMARCRGAIGRSHR